MSSPAAAFDVPIGDETLTLDVSNTSSIAYRFDNRNDTIALNPQNYVDDEYVEWFNRLYLRSYLWKFSLGVRLDSAVYANTFTREDAQNLVVEQTGAPDLSVENRFARELHSRYTSNIYPAKLWLGFKHKRFEATLGDFYAQLGRGMIFSVRKINEVGLDTTVRGGKVKAGVDIDGVNLEGTIFGGQMNPTRLDYPTGRLLHGSGSPLFFGFPEAGDFSFYRSSGPNDFELTTERAKPNYLEDNVIGANITAGPSEVQFEANAVALFRQSNSEDKQRCLNAGGTEDFCQGEFPTFSSPDTARVHDRIVNFGGAINVPTIDDTIDFYVEAAGQHQGQGRVATITVTDAGEEISREEDHMGYAVYANVNVHVGPLSATLEGKHYRGFYPLNANIDQGQPGFAAPEFNLVTYSVTPTAESIFFQVIGSPNVCNTGGRGRLDLALGHGNAVYGWVGRSTSFTEADPTNEDCKTDDALRTDTWDFAAGGDIEAQEGKTKYLGYFGARFVDHPVPVQVSSFPEPTSVFYREGYIRYDFNQHLTGPFSLTAIGFHRRQFEPGQNAAPFNQGENLVSFNWSPNWAFIFGYEYQTLPSMPRHYFNGSIVYRSKSGATWYDQLTDQVRLYVGQRRAALRCVGGVCRVFPAFEGAQFELVSRF